MLICQCGYPEGDELLEVAKELNVTNEKSKPIIMGRDLID
jgi:hypothetical protein